jgi:flagellum-specific ATP synthase
MRGCNSPEEQQLVNAARRHRGGYEDVAELVRLGAYRRGSDATIDAAIHYQPALEAFLAQGKSEHCALDEGYAGLASILADGPDGHRLAGPGAGE